MWWSDSFKEVCREGIKKTFVQAALVRQFLSEGSINLLTRTFWSLILSPRDLEWQHHMVPGGTSNSGAETTALPYSRYHVALPFKVPRDKVLDQNFHVLGV